MLRGIKPTPMTQNLVELTNWVQWKKYMRLRNKCVEAVVTKERGQFLKASV